MTDQSKRPIGRPRLKGSKVRNIVLDDESIEIAKAIGEGNISAGVRTALAAMLASTKPLHTPDDC